MGSNPAEGNTRRTPDARAADFLPDEVPYESCPIRCMQLVYSKVTHHNTYTHGIRCACSISRKTAKENYER